ncbi:MAG: hypothetical protein QOD00_202 [Blastocatellia bacterium]|nr:hypothetical protein [Blastocatellia bacterium]
MSVSQSVNYYLLQIMVQFQILDQYLSPLYFQTDPLFFTGHCSRLQVLAVCADVDCAVLACGDDFGSDGAPAFYDLRVRVAEGR